MIERYNQVWKSVPRFEDYQRRSLVMSQHLARKLHIGAVKEIFWFLKQNKIFDENTKSTLKSMLNSMNASLS